MSTGRPSTYGPIYTELRQFTQDLCTKGVSAIESVELLGQRFGVQPTMCTIYKWRREFRGGKGERQALEEEEGEHEGLGPRLSKIAKKEAEKYCSACNREMSTRHYYEFHMLKVHDVLLGESKTTMEFLEKIQQPRRSQLIFRCDSCFGGELDYDRIEELQQHKLLEHGQQMRMPNWSLGSGKRSSPTKSGARATKKAAHGQTKYKPAGVVKKFLRRDKSMPPMSSRMNASSLRRRSARVPKPTSAMVQSLLLAKDFNEMPNGHHNLVKDEMEEHDYYQRSEHEVDEQYDDFGAPVTLPPFRPFKKAAGQRSLPFSGGLLGSKTTDAAGTSMAAGSAGVATRNNGVGAARNIRYSAGKSTGKATQQQQRNIPPRKVADFPSPNIVPRPSSLNNVFEREEEEEEEPFVTILNDGRLLEESTTTSAEQFTKHQGHQRMLSPASAALDAADSMLKLAFTAASSSSQSQAAMKPSEIIGDMAGPSSTSNSAALTPVTQSAALTLASMAAATMSAPTTAHQHVLSKHRYHVEDNAANSEKTSTMEAIDTQEKKGKDPKDETVDNKAIGNRAIGAGDKKQGKITESQVPTEGEDGVNPASAATVGNVVDADDWGNKMQRIRGRSNRVVLPSTKTRKKKGGFKRKKNSLNRQKKRGSPKAVEEQKEKTVAADVPSTPSAAIPELCTPTQQANIGSGGSDAVTMVIPQDDCTWFAHSLASQLRMMPPQLKELAKFRLQQVIFECNSSMFNNNTSADRQSSSGGRVMEQDDQDTPANDRIGNGTGIMASKGQSRK